MIEHFRAELSSVYLHVATAGDGPPVVLLHGFPEFWYSWRSQLPALAAAGFRAMAPDLRGYNLSERPQGVRQFAGRLLVGDVADLIERHAGGKAHVVGHDWGGIIAWRLAALKPELIHKLVILNAPHPARFRSVLLSNPLQWLRSHYVLVFQVPWLAERIVSAADFWLIRRAFRRGPVNPTAFSREDIEQYIEALRQPGALTAGLNYYRAALRYPNEFFKPPQQIEVPTLVIWGKRDPYLSPQLAEQLSPWVTNLHVEMLRASHWVQNDAAEEVNRLLVEFLRS